MRFLLLPFAILNKEGRYGFVILIGETVGHKIGSGDFLGIRDFHEVVGLKSILISYIKNII